MANLRLFLRNHKLVSANYLRKNGILFLFAVLTSTAVNAQQIEIKGKILEENTKVSVIGATIKIKKQQGAAVSNIDGGFSIKVKSLPVTLVITNTGYKSQEIDVYENEPLTVYLAEDLNKLSEVVVVGYGTQKRKELTGAFSSVSKSHLEYNTAPSVDGLLSGAVAGLNVIQNSGQPGSPAKIRIRGGNSVNASNDPLYVIDGFLYFSDNTSTKVGLGGIEGESNPLNLLNPADIESIEVLKDVSATSIYGSRGSNGVILITTKKGQKGRNSINYQYTLGLSKSAKKLDLLTASQWARLQKDYFLNKPGYTDEEIQQLGDGYDWQGSVLQTGISENHAISINGGDDKSQYFISGNYLNQDGVVLNSGFKRFVGKLNYNKELFKGFSIGLTLTGTKSTQNSLTTFEGVNYNSSPYSKGIANSLTYALYIPRVVPIYNTDGGYNFSNPYEYEYLREGSTTANPVYDLKNSTAQTINTAFLGNFFAQYKISTELTAKASIGSNISHTTQNFFASQHSALGLEPDGLGGVGNKRVEIMLSEFTLSYTKQFNKIHSLEALAGFTYEKTNSNFLTATAKGLTTYDELGFNHLERAQRAQDHYILNDRSNSDLTSILWRVNYSLLDRYHLTANFRSDYSTKFINFPWGVFPSIGVSWNLNEEKFLKNAKSLSNLKVRASYGIVGNQEIDAFLYANQMKAVWVNGAIAFVQSNTGNPNLKWETTSQFNFGVDAGFLNNKISVVADLYYKKTSDLLLQTPQLLGQQNKQMENTGNVVNKGAELGVNLEILNKRKLSWTVSANIARNFNEITALKDGTDIIDGVNILRVGEPLNAFYGLKFDGIVQKGEDVSKLPTTPAYTTFQPGDPKFVDVSNDGHIGKEDRVALGSPEPKFTYGLSSTFKYHNFDFFILLNGSQGNKVYNLLRRYLESPNDAYNASAVLINAWTETNPSTTVPRITSNPISSELDSRYIEDASYLRLKTFTVGYTFSKVRFLSSKQPFNFRFFATLENLLTITGYKGYDPEVAKGLDLGSYPMSRTFQFGASISL